MVLIFQCLDYFVFILSGVQSIAWIHRIVFCLFRCIFICLWHCSLFLAWLLQNSGLVWVFNPAVKISSGISVPHHGVICGVQVLALAPGFLLVKTMGAVLMAQAASLSPAWAMRIEFSASDSGLAHSSTIAGVWGMCQWTEDASLSAS